MELNNLGGNPEYAGKMEELKRELATWAEAQGDDLQPHREPYPVGEPIPGFENGGIAPKGKAKSKGRSKAKTNE